MEHLINFIIACCRVGGLGVTLWCDPGGTKCGSEQGSQKAAWPTVRGL